MPDQDTSISAVLLPTHDSNPLAYPYFIFLLFLLLASMIIAIWISPALWAKRLNALRPGKNSNRPEDYMSLKDYATTSFLDDLLQAMPGIFLIIGLSGTFISLSIVLMHLKTALAQGNANQILETLGTKFKISVWGIFCNILYRLAYSSSMGKLSTLVKATYDRLTREAQTAQTNHRDQLLAKIDTGNTQLVQISTATQNFNTMAVLLQKSTTDFGETINKSATSIYTSTDTFAGAAGNITEAIKSFKEETTQSLELFTKSTETFDKNISTAFETFATSVNGTLVSISTELNPLIGTIKTQTTTTQVILSNVEAMLKKLDNVIAESNKTHTDLTKTIEGNNQVLGRMNISFQDLVEVLGALVKKLDNNENK